MYYRRWIIKSRFKSFFRWGTLGKTHSAGFPRISRLWKADFESLRFTWIHSVQIGLKNFLWVQRTVQKYKMRETRWRIVSVMSSSVISRRTSSYRTSYVAWLAWAGTKNLKLFLVSIINSSSINHTGWQMRWHIRCIRCAEAFHSCLAKKFTRHHRLLNGSIRATVMKWNPENLHHDKILRLGPTCRYHRCCVHTDVVICAWIFCSWDTQINLTDTGGMCPCRMLFSFGGQETCGLIRLEVFFLFPARRFQIDALSVRLGIKRLNDFCLFFAPDHPYWIFPAETPWSVFLSSTNHSTWCMNSSLVRVDLYSQSLKSLWSPSQLSRVRKGPLVFFIIQTLGVNTDPCTNVSTKMPSAENPKSKCKYWIVLVTPFG